MAYDLAPLHSYVRFYQNVATQLSAAWENVARTHEAARGALAAFAEPLAPVGSPALEAAVAEAPPRPAALRELWKPADPDGLTGFTDVYEVVGRFAFQGEDDSNLSRVQALVAGARNEIAAQRARLSDLSRLPEVARACAERLAAEETSRAAARRAERHASFEPLAEVLRARAKQTTEVMHGVAAPDLSNADAAAEEYRRYVTKLEHVYQTCLPYLRKALSALFGFVGAEVPASWPDALPLVPELPPELIRVPPADSEELSQAQAALKSLADEDAHLRRARDEIATAGAKVEGELAACLTMGNEAASAIERATLAADYLAQEEQARALSRSTAQLEQQRETRMRATADVMQRYRGVEVALQALAQELQVRAQEIAAAQQQLAGEEKDEPVLFGKDEWRARVAEMRARLDALRAMEAQRTSAMNQLKVDLASLSVEVQTEQQHVGLCERGIADGRAREQALRASQRELASRLGPERPAPSAKASDAEEQLVALQQARGELEERIGRLKAEARRIKEENVRVLSRQKQIEAERQNAHAAVQSAHVAATQGREAAAKQLAAERKAAVERHVGEVLAGLDRSLASVDAVFVDPAREALAGSEGTGPAASAVVKEHAEKLAPVAAAMVREIEPELSAQDATLAQIQREFCGAAPQACRAAWG